MSLTTRGIEKWLNPWPITSYGKNRKWSIKILPLETVLKYKNPNKIHNLKIIGREDRVTFLTLAKAMVNNVSLPNLDTRYIELLERSWVRSADNLTIIAGKSKTTKGLVVYDGSSRLTALAYSLAKGDKPKITHVAVVMPISK
jgi:hypothetical protein